MRIKPRRQSNFSWSILLVRLFGSLFLVLSTYNPTGWSLLHWTAVGWREDWMLLLPLIVSYLIAFFIVLRITYRSLTPVGIALTVAFFSSVVWVLVTAGIIPLANAGDAGIILLYVFGGVLTVGLVWSAAYLRLTGQVSVDNLNA